MVRVIKYIIGYAAMFFIAALTTLAVIYLLNLLGVKQYKAFYAIATLFIVGVYLKPKLSKWMDK